MTVKYILGAFFPIVIMWHYTLRRWTVSDWWDYVLLLESCPYWCNQLLFITSSCSRWPHQNVLYHLAMWDKFVVGNSPNFLVWEQTSDVLASYLLYWKQKICKKGDDQKRLKRMQKNVCSAGLTKSEVVIMRINRTLPLPYKNMTKPRNMDNVLNMFVPMVLH